jgi:hypothetical protein
MLVKCLWVTLLAAAPGVQSSSEDAAPKSTRARPKLAVVGEETIDLGKIFEREKINAVFTLENQGDADLVIEHVKTTCGCTTVKLTEREKVISPGGRQEIKVKFDSRGRPGKQSMGVTVISNDRERPRLGLHFTVMVETLFRTLPADRYDFRSVRRGQQLARAIDVIPAKKEGELEIVSVNIPPALFHHSVEPLPGGGRGHRIRLTVDEDAPLGRVRQKATFTIRVGDSEETRDLHLVGTILGDLVVRPLLVKLERPTLRGNHLRPLTISSVTGEPFEILSASAGPEFEISVEPQEGRAKYTIKTRIADSAADGPWATFLEVRTDSLLQPLLRVPIFAYVAPRVAIEPPLVLLRTGESPEASTRRVALQNPAGDDFAIVEVSVDEDFLEVSAVDRPNRPAGSRFLEVSLKDDLASGHRQATITVKTDLPGAELLEIPVVVTPPKSDG